MTPRYITSIEAEINTLQSVQSFSQASDTIQYLLDTFGERLAAMPHYLLNRTIDTLTGGAYGHLFEDVDASTAERGSPLVQLYRTLEHVFPAARVTNFQECEVAAVKVFQRLKERQAPLSWQMVHPKVLTETMRLTKGTIDEAFALQQSLGQMKGATYPVIFSLNYPVVCMIQSLYIDPVLGLRQQTLVVVVRRGFLRMTVMPWYMLGYDGFDGLVWLQKGFRVRVGGFRLSPEAAMLRELAWYLTDYRLARRVACHPETGVVVRHDARQLVR